MRLVVIDYVQLLKGESSYSREGEVAGISRELKLMSQEFDVHILALSQMNRAVESRDDTRPVLSDLRESGALEQDADNVFGLYREAYYDKEHTDLFGVAEVEVLKQRQGRTGIVYLGFQSDLIRFRSVLPHERKAYECRKRP